MKNLILLLVLGFLGSCCILGWVCCEYQWEHDIQVKNPNQAMEWIFKNIKYKDDPTDYYQTPKETYDWKTGDCEDVVILHMQLCHELGHETFMYGMERKDNINHSVSKVGDFYYDIVDNKKYKKIENVRGFKKLLENPVRTYSECISYIGKSYGG